MKNPEILFSSVCACLISSGQVPEVRPQVAGRPVREGQVTVVYLAPRFTTAIRMPDSLNSVVLGDPDSFAAEHSEREPQIVFVKPITAKASQTNLFISTAHGYQASLLLISRSESAGTQPNDDFLMRYRPPGRFVIEPSAPSVAIAQKVVLQTSNHAAGPAGSSTGAVCPSIERASFNAGQVDISLDTGSHAGVRLATQNANAALGLKALMERQRRAPLPALYVEKPGTAPRGRQVLKAGVREVIDQGKEVVVLFSVVNVQDHAVELMPPQVQVGGKVKKGTIVRHSIWSNSEQLRVEEFRMSLWRIGPGERADGVLIFQRPSSKQSNEHCCLRSQQPARHHSPARAQMT